MCLGAIYWARPDKIYYANTREDAQQIGFDDSFIYEEIPLEIARRKIPMIALERAAALEVFKAWQQKTDKKEY